MHGFDCYSTVIWLVQDKVRLLDDLASARRAARRLPLLTHPLLAPHLPTQHDTTATLDSVPVLCHTLTQ